MALLQQRTDGTKKRNKLTPKQQLMLKYYLDVTDKTTFLKKIKSGLKAGYSKESYQGAGQKIDDYLKQNLIDKPDNATILEDLSIDTIKKYFDKHINSKNEAISASATSKMFDYWIKLLDIRYKYQLNTSEGFDSLSTDEMIGKLKNQKDRIDKTIAELQKYKDEV